MSCVPGDYTSYVNGDDRLEKWQGLSDINQMPVEVKINNGNGYP